MSGYRLTSETLGISLTPGESFTTANYNALSPTRNSIPSLADPPVIWKTRLPPAVANVPPDHIRSYIHQKKVNHYLVGQKLGEGSFAKVKEAFHVLVGEKVAMKVIDKKKAQQDPYVAKNFRREAKLLQMVRHPNILQLLEVIETDNSFYLITELCSGGELMKYIYKKGHLDENETRKYMRHIVSAVDHLHRAGIIHRDLKVENLLLDANMDIKLIDFGLSNEEYVQGENGMVHCNTQCGSPAYAAPELLGHKPYGPQVDIWSIGVNMYAMLTGCLPYTVEPFNITALHAKMLENKMNPIPENLSKNCKDLLRNLLRSNPDERLKIPQIMMHPWMNEGHALPFGPAPFPNRLDLVDLDEDIVQHMVHVLRLRDNEEELKQELISNRATQGASVYHLLTARLARFRKQFRKSSMRPRHSRVSRDQGFFEEDDDDVQSTMSMPTRRPSRASKRAAGCPGRGYHAPEPPKEETSQAPTLIEVEEGDGTEKKVGEEDEFMTGAGYNRHRRRSTMPEMMLKDDIEALREKMKRREEGQKIKRPAATPSNHRLEGIARKDEHSDASRYRHDHSKRHSSYLAPIERPNVKLKKNPYSIPSGLNEVREQLKTHLPQQSPVKEAWRSNPGSRATSRQPSRHNSRHPSGVSRPTNYNSTSTSSHTRAASYDEHGGGNEEEEELTFHEVSSQTLPRSYRYRSHTISDPSSTLPSITNPQGAQANERLHGRSRTHSDSSKNIHNPPGPDFRPALEFSESLAEIERAANSLKIRDVERRGYNSVICTWNGIKIQIFVNKEQDTHKVSYSWLSGGNMKSFNEKRDKLAKRIRL